MMSSQYLHTELSITDVPCILLTISSHFLLVVTDLQWPYAHVLVSFVIQRGAVCSPGAWNRGGDQGVCQRLQRRV